jgi:hypothetical protein
MTLQGVKNQHHLLVVANVLNSLKNMTLIIAYRLTAGQATPSCNVYFLRPW